MRKLVVTAASLLVAPLLAVSGVFGVLVIPAAYAQGLDQPTSLLELWRVLTDVAALTALGASVWALARFIRATVSFVKTNFNPRLGNVPLFTGWRTYGLSMLLGTGLSFLIWLNKGLTDVLFSGLPAPLNWILFGLAAGLFASGSADLERSRSGGADAKTPAGAAATARPGLQ